MPRENISSQVPPGLQTADDLLTSYGRWAADRPHYRRCGSAEGEYRPGQGEALESRRQSQMPTMRIDDAMLCQRALARVPTVERVILSVLYIPKRLPAEAQLRILKIPPKMSRERHLTGLRMFDNIRAVLERQLEAA